MDVTEADALDVWFDVEEGRIVAFCVNYRAHLDEEWREVIRYDSAHGRLHVHEFGRDGREVVRGLGEPEIRDYTTALHDAMADLPANWRTYRARRVVA